MVDNFVSIISVIIITAISMPVLLIALAMKLNKYFGEWVCQELDFHLPPDEPEFDYAGLNYVGLIGKCPRCGKTVLSDDYGGWFSIS